MELSGICTASPLADGSFAVMESRAEASVPLLELAPDILLKNGRVVLSSCAYKANLHLQGTLEYSSGDVEVTGKIDASIDCLKEKYTVCAVSTLITDASIRLPPSLHLDGGTIRLEYCSKLEHSARFKRQFDENDELLYQITEPITLGASSIEGESGKPVTLWAELSPSSDDHSRLLLHLFPSRLKMPCIGDRTILFLHGNSGYDAPFTIDPSGPWCASVSSNVFLHLVASDEPDGKALLTATVFVEGTVTGNGMHTPAIHLFTKNPMQATLFPDLPIARNLPVQPFNLRSVPGETPVFSLLLETPLQLTDRTTVLPADAETGLIRCTVDRKGLCFDTVRLVSPHGTASETCYRCIVNGEGRIVEMVTC